LKTPEHAPCSHPGGGLIITMEEQINEEVSAFRCSAEEYPNNTKVKT